MWAANLSGSRLRHELICSIRLRNALIQGTLWSSRRQWTRYQLHTPVPGESYVFPEMLPPWGWGGGRMVWDTKRLQKWKMKWEGKQRGDWIDREQQRASCFFSSLCLPSATLPLPAAFSFTLSWQGTRRIVGKGLPWKGRSQPLISSYCSSPFSLISVFNLALLVAFGIWDWLKC